MECGASPCYRKHYLGTHHNDIAPEVAEQSVQDVTWHEQAPIGKMDLVVDLALEALRRSPVYRYVKQWRLALPLHPEFRTLPMLYYVPPLQPAIAAVSDGVYDTSADGLFAPVDQCRAPISYLARLFGGGNEAPVRYALKKMLAVRTFKRLQTVGDVPAETVQAMMDELGTNAEELEESTG